MTARLSAASSPGARGSPARPGPLSRGPTILAQPHRADWLQIERTASRCVRYDATLDVHLQILMHVQLPYPPQKGHDVDLVHDGTKAGRLDGMAWRKSRHSNPSGNCVEIAELPGGAVAIRNSRHPDGPALVCQRPEFAAFLVGARDGEFDGLAR